MSSNYLREFEIRESHPITPKGRQKTKLNPLSPLRGSSFCTCLSGGRSYELHTLPKVLRPVGAYRSIALSRTHVYNNGLRHNVSAGGVQDVSPAHSAGYRTIPKMVRCRCDRISQPIRFALRKVADPSTYKRHLCYAQTPFVQGTNRDLSIITLRPLKVAIPYFSAQYCKSME